MLDILVAALRGAMTAASAARARRRDIAALRAMDAHALSDIGIARGQIEAYVDGRLSVGVPSWEEERAARYARASRDIGAPRRRPTLRLVHSA